MLRIHQHLIDEKYPNCSKLGKSLEVSSKTIQRDLDYMRDQLNLPIDYENSRHGYYYTEPVTHFPTIPTTEGELLALFVAQKALQQYRGTSFEKPLANAFEKLAQVMEDEVTVSLQELTDSLSFHHTGAAVMDMEVFQAVHTASPSMRAMSPRRRPARSSRIIWVPLMASGICLPMILTGMTCAHSSWAGSRRPRALAANSKRTRTSHCGNA